MSPLLKKTGRKAVAAASSDQARRPSLGGHVAGAPGLGRDASTADADEIEEVEGETTEEEKTSRWKVRLPWRRSKPEQEEPGVGGADWDGSADLTTKVLKVAFVGALVAGPAALLMSLGEDAPVVVQKGGEDSEKVAPAVVSDSTVAGERGLQTVRTWLASSVDSRQIQMDIEGSWPKTGQKVESSRVASVTRSEDAPDQWEVVVAAELPEDGEMHFAVPVRVANGKAVAVSLPRVAPAPSGTVAPATEYEKTGIDVDAPLSQATEEFLGAYLAGEETTRFTSPGARLRAVSGNPWAQVQLTRVDATVDSGADPAASKPEEGEKAQVLVEYAMQREGDSTTRIPSSMAMTLKARGGRWEVESIDQTPQVSSTQTSPSPDGDSTTPTE